MKFALAVALLPQGRGGGLHQIRRRVGDDEPTDWHLEKGGDLLRRASAADGAHGDLAADFHEGVDSKLHGPRTLLRHAQKDEGEEKPTARQIDLSETPRLSAART